MSNFLPKTFNTILYCAKWQATVTFYRDVLGFPITFATDWFIEFKIAEAAYLSLADERRTSIRSSAGAGLTLTFQVDDADKSWRQLQKLSISLEPVQEKWGARLFYFYDPEGHRLEIWSLLKDKR